MFESVVLDMAMSCPFLTPQKIIKVSQTHRLCSGDKDL